MIVLSHFSLFSQAGAILVQRLVGVVEVIVDVLLVFAILMTIILFMKVIDFFVIFMIFITF